MLDELYTVETPEQIELAYDVAGIGSRALAALIDHIIIAVLILLSMLAIIFVSSQFENVSGVLIGFVLAAFWFLILCGYYILFETVWNGQTPGKRVMKIRMLHVSGRPINFAASAIRNLLRIVDFLPFAYGLGFLAMFFDKRSRRLGDIAAGCMAVRQRDVVTLDSLAQPDAGRQPVVATAQQITIPNLDVLRRDEIDVIETFLRRSYGFTPEARQRLAAQLVAGLQDRLGYPIGGDHVAFLVQVVSEYQALERERAR